MKRNKKAGVSLALNFLIGLIFTGFLILVAFKVVTHFMAYDSHEERDLVKQWVTDISNLKINRYTNLYWTYNSDVSKNYIFAFVEKDRKDVDLKSEVGLKSENLFSPISAKINCAKNQICICAIRMDSGYSYCKGLEDLEFTVKVTQDRDDRVQKKDEYSNLPFFITSQYSVRKYIDFPTAPFVYRTGTDSLIFCDTREACKG